MPQSGWTGVATPAVAATRAADALLRTIGATSVVFRFLLASSRSGDGAQLGATPANMEEITVAPVMVRTPRCATDLRGEFELVLSASTLNDLIEQRGATDITSLIAQVAQIEWNSRSFRVQKIASELFAGSEYLYRLYVAE